MVIVMTKKAKKGTASVCVFNGMLAIQLPRSLSRKVYNISQKRLFLGIPDTFANRQIAETKACEINLDIICNRFDTTLERYKIQAFLSLTKIEPVNKFDLVTIFKNYVEFQKKHLAPSSCHNYPTIMHKLEKMPEDVLKSAQKIKNWLLENTTQEQARRTLMKLSAACDFAIEQELLKENPFAKLKQIKKKTSAIPDAFTEHEKNLIIEGFKEHDNFFLNFVQFLFLTGCRPSEASALRWANVDLIDNFVLFCEAFVEGQLQKRTKTGKNRKFPINDQLKKLLLSQQQYSQEYDLVFLSRQDSYINITNFSRKHWKPILLQLNIRFRGCYHCRHTFITYCLLKAIPLHQVASWVGNSPEVLLKHYASVLQMNVPLL